MIWNSVAAEMPLVAILRGVAPHEAVGIGTALLDAGFVCAEVPLNSPEPTRSIAAMRQAFGERMLVGAGTVLSAADVDAVAAAGAQFVVSPNTNQQVIAAAKRRGLTALPGFLTPTEAFAAIEAGADALKLFPADQAGPAFIKALRAVLPPTLPIFAVGGVDAGQMKAYLGAGATGFGLGSSLYKPGDDAALVAARAHALVNAFRAARA